MIEHSTEYTDHNLQAKVHEVHEETILNWNINTVRPPEIRILVHKVHH